MPHVLSWVRIAEKDGILQGRKEGLRKGLQEGRGRGLREAIELSLRVKFGKGAARLLPRLRRIVDPGQLRRIQKRILAAGSIAELLEALKQGKKKASARRAPR